jgi:hypothetical protein
MFFRYLNNQNFSEVKLTTILEKNIMTKIILEGITLEDFQSLLRESVRAEISANESKKIAPMTKSEACRRIGITNKTLQKILSEMNLKDVYPSDINRILLKYPKFIKKAAKVEI